MTKSLIERLRKETEKEIVEMKPHHSQLFAPFKLMTKEEFEAKYPSTDDQGDSK